MWSKLGHAIKVKNVAPRILNWKCIGRPTYDSLQKNLFDVNNLTTYKDLSPSNDEVTKPYWESLNSWVVLNNVKFGRHSGCFDDNDSFDDDVQVDEHINDGEWYRGSDDDDVQGDTDIVHRDDDVRLEGGYEIKEGGSCNKRKKDNSREKIRVLNDRLDNLEVQFKAFSTRHDKHFKNVKDEMVVLNAQLDEHVKNVKDEMVALNARLDEHFKKVNAETVSMLSSFMNEIRKEFQQFTKLIMVSNTSNIFDKTCQQTPLHANDKSENITTNDVMILNSSNNNIYDLATSVVRDVSSPSTHVGSPDVVLLSRPPELTIKLNRDRKRSAFMMSPLVDPTTKMPKKPKMSEFGLESQVDNDSLHSLNKWLSDSHNKSLDTGLLMADPIWFQKILSPFEWLESDHMETYCRLMRCRAFHYPYIYSHDKVLLDYSFMIKIQGRWSSYLCKHGIYDWDNGMVEYVHGKIPVHAWKDWSKVKVLLFPANINNIHWVAIEVNLTKRMVNIYDSKPDITTNDVLFEWATCLTMMLPSLLVQTMPDTYSNITPFDINRPRVNVPIQDGWSDCGIFTLKYLECLWAGQPFQFGAKDSLRFREQITIEIFQNCKRYD